MIFPVIPAKVLSGRLPFKNTFQFYLGNKPLIQYTIDAVKNAGYIPTVYTNEFNGDDIKTASARNGCVIVPRVDSLCTSKTTMKETVKSYLELMNAEDNDTVLLTYLTCPFRTGEDIKNCLDRFNAKNCNSLQTITEVDYRPYGLIRYKMEIDRYVCMHDQMHYYQSQNTPKLYRANGAIYVFKVHELDKFNNQMFNDSTECYELDNIHGHDIDTVLDYYVAEMILERQKNGYTFNKLPNTDKCETESYTNWTSNNIKYFEASRT